ncbi:hypothetical protein QR680_001487 [Steinernema hermaphroditum]|uniref:Uncharacterized protein n=1 Tax=Steinernema hermaphroditum TaxID=289476 RepID=A0AA39H1C0_9BILA|nr:hypothetical protein QR680_001487 [Steinernema hermaphroditum]
MKVGEVVYKLSVLTFNGSAAKLQSSYFCGQRPEMLLKTFVLAICVAQLVHTGYGHSIEGRKLSVRTKRQHCSCVIINVQNQQLQCSCDSNEKNGQALLPQQQRMDQQELQQELSHMQATPNAQCGCVLIVIQNGAQGIQAPQYQCQCSTSHNPSNGNGQKYPGQTHLPTLMTTTTPTTTTHYPIVPTTVPHRNGGNRQQNPCQCVMISVREGPQSQYQCDCDQRGNFENLPGKSKEASHGNYNNDQVGYGSGNVNGRVDAYHTTYINDDNKQGSFETNGNGYHEGQLNIQNGHVDHNTAFSNTDEKTYHGSEDKFELPSQTQHSSVEPPPTHPCIIIRLPQNAKACICQDDYVQCGENMCCLSSRYRSMKGNTKSEGTGENSAVDLIMDVLKSIKTNLQKP